MIMEEGWPEGGREGGGPLKSLPSHIPLPAAAAAAPSSLDCLARSENGGEMHRATAMSPTTYHGTQWRQTPPARQPRISRSARSIFHKGLSKVVTIGLPGSIP